MTYLYVIGEKICENRSALLANGNEGKKSQDIVDYKLLAQIIRSVARSSLTENQSKLDTMIRLYAKLGGEYATFSNTLKREGPNLLNRTRQDLAEFGDLIENWPTLCESAKTTKLTRNTTV
jgi:CRISPR/Cas system-associated endonuclease Cas3-HD